MVRVDRLSVSPYLRCTHISLHLSVTSAVYNGAEVGLLVLLCSVFFFPFCIGYKRKKVCFLKSRLLLWGSFPMRMNYLGEYSFLFFFFFVLTHCPTKIALWQKLDKIFQKLKVKNPSFCSAYYATQCHLCCVVVILLPDQQMLYFDPLKQRVGWHCAKTCSY